MSKLALNIPGFDDSLNLQSRDISKDFKLLQVDSLNKLISTALNVVFFAAALLMLYNLILGAFRYLSAGDNKDNVAKARQRITWALFGFVFIIAAFSVSQYVKSVLPAGNPALTDVTTPPGITTLPSQIKDKQAQAPAQDPSKPTQPKFSLESNVTGSNITVTISSSEDYFDTNLYYPYTTEPTNFEKDCKTNGSRKPLDTKTFSVNWVRSKCRGEWRFDLCPGNPKGGTECKSNPVFRDNFQVF